MPFKYFLTA